MRSPLNDWPQDLRCKHCLRECGKHRSADALCPPPERYAFPDYLACGDTPEKRLVAFAARTDAYWRLSPGTKFSPLPGLIRSQPGV